MRDEGCCSVDKKPRLIITEVSLYREKCLNQCCCSEWKVLWGMAHPIHTAVRVQ